ncbi:hypothetical protein CDN99_07550 [Roseateles aquatilis]|uniref:IPTL-CTERM protein sorting domain-containing protein n=1 Tax=Roseateles aquatilis TaxID=431061 RepID=A0A246JHQ3_9BURK|nr:hypothetical protein [Roseateles aquatilis]OWQ92186.1 hypothetical protein CDN99_07550 [Roseateles aquatilis]
MHLRKLAWAVPLLLAATAAQAEGSGSFLEGAKLAALVRPEAAAPSNSPPHDPVDARTAASSKAFAPSPTTVSALSLDVADSAGKRPEIRNVLTLVAALALVGWIQRRRPDA